MHVVGVGACVCVDVCRLECGCGGLRTRTHVVAGGSCTSGQAQPCQSPNSSLPPPPPRNPRPQAFPICLPGTAVWRARKGRLYIFEVLKVAAARAREHIKARPRGQSCLRMCVCVVGGGVGGGPGGGPVGGVPPGGVLCWQCLLCGVTLGSGRAFWITRPPNVHAAMMYILPARWRRPAASRAA